MQHAEEVGTTLHASLEQQLMAFQQTALHHHGETLRALDTGDYKSVRVRVYSGVSIIVLILLYSCIHGVFAAHMFHLGWKKADASRLVLKSPRRDCHWNLHVARRER